MDTYSTSTREKKLKRWAILASPLSGRVSITCLGVCRSVVVACAGAWFWRVPIYLPDLFSGAKLQGLLWHSGIESQPGRDPQGIVARSEIPFAAKLHGAEYATKGMAETSKL